MREKKLNRSNDQKGTPLMVERGYLVRVDSLKREDFCVAIYDPETDEHELYIYIPRSNVKQAWGIER